MNILAALDALKRQGLELAHAVWQHGKPDSFAEDYGLPTTEARRFYRVGKTLFGPCQLELKKDRNVVLHALPGLSIHQLLIIDAYCRKIGPNSRFLLWRELAEAAPGRTLAELSELAKKRVREINPNTDKNATALRRVVFSTSPDINGQSHLLARGPAEHMAHITSALEQVTQHHWNRDTDDRSFTQAMFDSLYQLTTTTSAHPEPTQDYGVAIVVRIPELNRESLASSGEGREFMTSQGAIMTTRQYLQAQLANTGYAIITDRNNHPVELHHLTKTDGTQPRFANRAQRFALACMQGVCAKPGCHRYALNGQAHHIIPHHQGGQTNPANMVLLCPTHHAEIPHHGTIYKDSEGKPMWRNPDGSNREGRFPIHDINGQALGCR
ncbi:hypothetical protein GSS88_02610 [Corynebacterium sp. 3HC-13]|nr:HNH endonuclease signature motif containing protein [Corynebacterium poyangense]MBZ8176690.1 hypothetical protein [Corynebacterium poyangense]